jgi:hypothetical protein
MLYTNAQRTALFYICQDFRNLANFRHGNPIAQEQAIGRVVDVGLHHGGIDAQPPSANDLLLACHDHHPDVKLLDNLRTERDGELAQGLGVGHLLGPDASAW